MPREIAWHGWGWDPKIDTNTKSGALLHRLTAAMALQPDIRECGLLVFGSSPIEFGLGIPVNSGDIDVTPDQFYPIFDHFLQNANLSKGDPHVQCCPPGIFRPASLWHTRAARRIINGIEVLLPHPIDIIAGKLHRLDRKDYEGIEAIVASQGRPTHADLRTYVRENPDYWLVGGIPHEELINKIEALHAYLGGTGLDIKAEFMEFAQKEYRLGLGEQSPDDRMNLAQLKTLDSRSDDSYPVLPDKFGKNVISYPECSYGAVRVILVLQDGTWIRDVIIGGNAICKIGGKLIKNHADLEFSISDVVEIKQG